MKYFKGVLLLMLLAPCALLDWAKVPRDLGLLSVLTVVGLICFVGVEPLGGLVSGGGNGEQVSLR